MTSGVIDVAVVAGIPVVQGLIETVKPVRRGRVVGDLLPRNCMRDEDRNWVADEHVGQLDVAPEEVPDVSLGRVRLGHKITADLDMRSVQNRPVRGQLLDQGNQARHLWVINLALVSIHKYRSLVIAAPCSVTYDNNIGTAFRSRPKRAALRKPVTLGILGDPVKNGLLLLGGNALIRVADSLQDIVDVLGDSEDTRPRFGDCSKVSNG